MALGLLQSLMQPRALDRVVSDRRAAALVQMDRAASAPAWTSVSAAAEGDLSQVLGQMAAA
jgi:hypothetical protein